MNHYKFEKIVNRLLETSTFRDCIPNGLQVEGRADVRKLITGVTACQLLLNEAVTCQADAVLVHHGYFWKNEPEIIKGIKRQRLSTLLANDINLYCWHLPLDAHPELGNNAQLAKLIGLNMKGRIMPLVFWGEFTKPINPQHLARRIADKLEREPLHYGDNAPLMIQRVAWCTGRGQSFIDSVVAFGVDAFITGEVSEQTIHSAREQGIHFFAAGHHATERGGVKALGEWLAFHHSFDVTFIDIPNPA